MHASNRPPVMGSLFLYHLSRGWREGVGAGSGQSCWGTDPALGASWLLKADLLGDGGGFVLLLGL